MLCSLTLDNPVNLRYTGHTIATNTELAFEPNELGWFSMAMWGMQRFFRTPQGRVVAVILFVAALAVAALTGGVLGVLLFVGMVGVGLGLGATVAGLRARDSGDCFWEGFSGFIREDWAMSVAISSVMFMAAMGAGGVAGAAKAGFAKIGASKAGAGVGVSGKTQLPNGVTVRVATASDFTPGAWAKVKGLSSNANGTVSTMADGRAIHYGFMENLQEKISIKGAGKKGGVGRVDAIDWSTSTIFELKPNNPLGIAQGKIQLARYQQAMLIQRGKLFNIVLVLY